jgi:hypothetical protein
MVVNEAVINAMENVHRALGQFGYWGNDAYTFHDGNRWGVCRVFVYEIVDNSDLLNALQYLAMDIWFAIPNLMLSEDGHDNAAEGLNEGTRAENVRNSQWAMAKLISQQLNYFATEVGSTFGGMTIANGGVDAPLINSVAGPWGVDIANIWNAIGAEVRFEPCDNLDSTAFTPNTQPFIRAVCGNGAAWKCDFIFMDWHNTFYNSIGGAFATGVGYKTRNGEFPYVANVGLDGRPYEKRWNRMDYISSVAGHPVADFKAAYLDAFQELYTPAQLTAGGDLRFSGGKTKEYYVFPRSTSMISSRYFLYESVELMEARKMDSSSNTREVKDILNVLPAYGYKRGIWQEYDQEYYAPSIYIDSSMAYQSLSFQMVNDSREIIYAASAESVYDDLPAGAPSAPGFNSLIALEPGAVYGYPEVNSVLKYREGVISQPALGVIYPPYFRDRGIRCPPGTNIICFASAKSL